MPDAEEPDSPRYLVPDIISSAIVAGVSLTGPEQAFLASTQAPVLMHIARQAAEELAPRIRTMRAGRALAAACEAGQLSPEELQERICASTNNVDLTEAALSGAATARFDARIIVLGRALATGLMADDQAEVDVEQLVITAVSDLDASHVRLLDLACEEDHLPQNFEAAVASRARALMPHLGVLVSTLTRHHLMEVQVESVYDRTSVMRRQAIGGASFAPERMDTERRTIVTEFGRLVRQRLHEAGAQSLQQ